MSNTLISIFEIDFYTFQNEQDIAITGFSGKNLELCILDTSFLHIGCFSAIQAKDMEQLCANDLRINNNASEIAAAIPFHPR